MIELNLDLPMHPFKYHSNQFEAYFNKRHFPLEPNTLYDASQYILGIGGKRVRPVAVLMACELFCDVNEDAFLTATAIELFHNFSLIHDDIMDKAPLRRGMETVHTKYGESTALLAGDVMLVAAYEQINKIDHSKLKEVLTLFNKTSKEVCEGQQMDMDFEKKSTVSMDDYIRMITLKTSVLLAASMKMGAIVGGATVGNQEHLYEFGKNIGIAFQIQDDYLDAFGDPQKFGKQIGGDILANKKTCLFIHALEVASDHQKEELQRLFQFDNAEKVHKVLAIFSDCKVNEWANKEKETYYLLAMKHLEELAVPSSRKTELIQLASYLLQRDV